MYSVDFKSIKQPTANGQWLTTILTALIVLSEFSCSNSTIGNKMEENAEFQIEHVVYEDSITSEDGSIYYKAEIDVPVAGPDSLLNQIKEWINEELGGSYTGELNCDTAMLSSYAVYFFENGIDDGQTGLGTQLTIRKIRETDTYVSYLMQGQTYTGGVHGMPFTKGMTFSKADGSRIDWDAFTDTRPLKPLLLHAIREQYFEGNDSDFVQAIDIMVKDTLDFPLPETDPWLITDSVQFVYQPYEIAPYAAGLPTCRIAAKELFPYLSQKAKDLF